MSRLPNPGSDNGTWGDILNDFLGVEHNADGTLKARTDGSFATLDSGKIPTSQLASGTASVSNFLRGDGTWAVPVGTVTPDADGSTKGRLRLSGDLGGTADSPQVVATHLSAPLPIAQGGTGAATQNFVDVSTAQTVGGIKTFTSAIDLSAVSGTATATGSSIGDKIALYSTGYGFGVQSSRLVAYVGGSTAGFAVRQVAGSGDRSSGVDGVVLGANGTGTFGSNITMTNGNMGLLATGGSATHTLTLGSTATGTAFYNTADQTTNYERREARWNGNVSIIATTFGGTGLSRPLQIGLATIAGNSSPINYLYISPVSTPAIFRFAAGTYGGTSLIDTSATLGGTTGTQYLANLQITANQSGTAGYAALRVNVTETATGSGTKLLADFAVGGTSKVSIDNTGSQIFHSGATTVLTSYNTSDETTNYERAKLYWSSNTFTIGTDSGGTGTGRNVQLTTATGRQIVLRDTPAAYTSGGIINLSNSTATANAANVTVGGSWTASSGVNQSLAVVPIVNQTGTAGYTMLLVNPTETATGSGAKLLADFQVSGSSQTSISNDGAITTRYQVIGGRGTGTPGLTVKAVASQTANIQDWTNSSSVALSSVDSGGNHIFHSGVGTSQYNTTDETTNYERLRMFWSSNVFNLSTEWGGTGTQRPIALLANGNTLTLGSSTTGLTFVRNNTAITSLVNINSNSLTASTGSQTALSITPTINQTSTAGYTMLLVNPTETATGSGTKLLADFQVGGSSKLKIDNTGTLTIPLNAGTGKVLMSDTNGAATWQSLGASYVDLTSNQTIGGTKTFSGSIVTSGHQNVAAYMFVGNTSAPVNTNTGDLTAMRLNIGNTAFLTSSTFVNLTGNIADTANAATVHTQIQPTIMPASDSQTSYRALNMSNLVQTTSNFITSSLITAGFFENRIMNAGTVNQLHGLTTTGLMGASTMSTLGTVTTVRAIEAQAISSFSNSVVATVQTAVGVHVSNPGINTLVLTSQAGVNIDALSGATNNTSLLIGQTSIPSGNYSIYSASTSNSYFAGSLGLGTNSPTHGLTLSSTNTGVAIYNTSDQTTNYERVRQYWSGNTFTIATENGGTGSARPVQLSAGGGTLALAGLLAFSKSTGSAAVTLFTLYGTQSQSTGTVTGMGITPSISQTGTAGYTALLVNPTETTTGSGAKLLADFQVGGTSKFNVDNSGVVTASNRITGVSNPTSPQDAATKNYVDSLIGTTQLINAQSGTTYTLVASDIGKLITLTNAAAITLTVPTNATVAFVVGARIDIAQTGAGQVTVAPAAGVTVNATPGLKLSSQYAGATLIKTATDTWLLFGSLAV